MNYLVPCVEDTDEEDEDVPKIEQSFSRTEKYKKVPSLNSKITKNRRSEISWQLPPNRYNIPNELGCSKKGIQWSLSKRSAQYKKDVKLQNTQRKFYEISTNYFEKSKNTCNCHKGKFSSDPRNRRPTTRFIINNPVTCWRNQNDPGPTTYFLGIFQNTSFPKKVKKHVVPYKFLRNSSVPKNLRLRILGNSSFSPGPGRYELLDDEQSLRKRLRFQTEQRMRFRRLHFKRKCFPKQNTSSINRHIFGFGFTRLFRGAIIMSSKKVISSKKSHKTGREIRMFPSFEYIKMITNPDRNILSMRIEEVLERSDILRFNCLVKAHKRRQLRDNKKVVFGSGVPRFKDSDMPIIRNQSKPPALVNFPIMTVNSKEIKTKLHNLPDRLRGIYKINRMQPFKFQPIPPVKLLLHEKEIHPGSEENLEVFTKELNPMDFVKNEFKKNCLFTSLDPSLPAGKRREIDNVMKKARANTNDYWDKKLLEVEEKDPNRWRHTGYKKMYIQGESSSGESDREGNFRYNAGGPGPSGGGGGGVGGPSGLNGRIGGPGMYHRPSRSPRSRSRSRLRKSPPLSPQMRRRSPGDHGRRMSPPPIDRRPRSPETGRRIMPPRSPPDMVGRRPGPRPRSPPEPLNNARRGKSPPRSPMGRRRSPGGMPPVRRHSPGAGSSMPPNKRGQILPRSKRPPSPPPRNSCRSRSNSSVSSCSDDSCSVCSPKHHRQYSRSTSLSRSRPAGGPRSPPPKQGPRGQPMSRPPMQYRGVPPNSMPSSSRVRPSTPPQVRGEKYREEKLRRLSRERSRDMLIERPPPESTLQMARAARHSPPEDPRLKNRPPEPMEQVVPKKKKKEPSDKLVRTRIKIEGEKRKKRGGSSSESDDSGSDSESSLPTFTATTRLTLSERFGKMAQWSNDRSNMENMRITKDSTGGALKVMIEEGLESPPRRYSYSPAPAGHFPEELATTAPSGMLSWDDVRVRYEYYKNRGYLRDLDLKDYIKWEEWWYKYQEWLKQERYYEFWERQQMHRRRRKKIPIAQRLN